MKKILLIASCFALTVCKAQEAPLSAPPSEKMNIIKTNVTAYAFRNINLTYERAINRWLSVNMGFGAMPEGKIPFINSFLSDDDERRFQNLEAKSFNFTIEPRFYLGAGYGKGFYVAPYYRYSKITTNTFDYYYDFTYSGTTYQIPLKGFGNANGNSGGVMVGAQFFLTSSRNLVLDFWIAGAHYGAGKGDFTMTSDIPLTPEMQAQLKREIEDLDVPFVNYTVETNTNGARVIIDGPWIGFRTGLSLGYRF